MVVVYYDIEKGEHITINNVYSVLDDKKDGFVTVCFEDETREYSKDVPKEYLTSINVSFEKQRDVRESLDDVIHNCKEIFASEQKKNLSENAVVDMTYAEMCNLFRAVERTHTEHVSGCVVITADSFSAPYSEAARTYVISSDNKAYQPNMGGYSVYGSSLDGSDSMVRLERYLAVEHGGKDGWKIERCYMKQNELNKAQSITGELRHQETR